MNKITIVFVSIQLLELASCATSSLGTTGYRQSNIDTTNIALSPNGLSKEQIDAILSTQFPPEHPVSISLFYLPNQYYDSYDPVPSIINKLNRTELIDRIVPIPSILYPKSISFDSIQQIGIRSLSEYSLLLFGASRDVFFSYKSPSGYYMLTSNLEFIIIDNKTTAIISSDKLSSEFQIPVQLFTDKAYEDGKMKMYEEQSQILYDKLRELFVQNGKK